MQGMFSEDSVFANLFFTGQGQRETRQDSGTLQTLCLTVGSPVDHVYTHYITFSYIYLFDITGA